MNIDVLERRQQRRADLKAQIAVRPLDEAHAGQAPVMGRVKNVSLSGVYAMVPATFSLPAGASVAVSVSIPQESTRQFPFVRLLGKGWVIRVDRPDDRKHGKRASHAKEPAHTVQTPNINLQEILGSGEEVGLVIAFTRDVTALGAVSASFSYSS